MLWCAYHVMITLSLDVFVRQHTLFMLCQIIVKGIYFSYFPVFLTFTYSIFYRWLENVNVYVCQIFLTFLLFHPPCTHFNSFNFNTHTDATNTSAADVLNSRKINQHTFLTQFVENVVTYIEKTDIYIDGFCTHKHTQI